MTSTKTDFSEIKLVRDIHTEKSTRRANCKNPSNDKHSFALTAEAVLNHLVHW